MPLRGQAGWPRRPLAAAAAALLLAARGEAAEAAARGKGPLSEPSTRWRVANLETVTYGWVVGELRLFADTTCSQELTRQPARSSITWQAIASGNHGAPPARAFDGNTWTEWRAQCYLCEEHEAWLGLSFSEPVTVSCLKLWQWDGYKTGQVMLERWEARSAEWQPVLLGSALDGGRWDTLQFVSCGALEAPEHGQVEVSNLGFFPSEASFTCDGMRILGGQRTLQCLPDGTWDGSPPTCWALLQLIVLLSAVLAVDAAAFFAYYFCVVLRRTSPPLQQLSFIPEDNTGSWTHDMIGDVRDDPNYTFLMFICCPCCRVADTWRGLGQVPFKVGAPLLHFLLPLLPCIGAFVRGNLRHRLGIPGKRSSDLMAWLCCLPCAAVQEAKTADIICQIAQEEAVAMRQDQERRQEILESQHKAAYEASAPKRAMKVGRPAEEEVPKAAPGPKAKMAPSRPALAKSRTTRHTIGAFHRHSAFNMAAELAEADNGV